MSRAEPSRSKDLFRVLSDAPAAGAQFLGRPARYRAAPITRIHLWEQEKDKLLLEHAVPGTGLHMSMAEPSRSKGLFRVLSDAPAAVRSFSVAQPGTGRYP